AHAQDLGDGRAQLLDVLALLADHDSRTRRVNGDVGAAGGTLDVDVAHRGIGQFLVQVLAHQEIGVDVAGKVLRMGVPLRRPVARDAQANTNWIDFLTHQASRLPSDT